MDLPVANEPDVRQGDVRQGGVRQPEARRRGWLDWLQPQWAATAIAALLVVVGIESVGVIPGLQRQLEVVSAPQVLHPAALRPVTRGDATELTARAGEPASLVFDLDRPPAAGTPLQFVIKSGNGADALHFEGPAPEPGQMVNVVFPALKLEPGDYTLVVYSGSGNGTDGKEEAGRYPFKLQPR